nr:gliding motility-associated C-terminal domain-containing protein [Winogradskyella psychrotolerans]
MEPGSTVRISIPVSAPSFGGAFNNIAEAFPDATNNQELTPESNISINSVQVIAPVLQKSFVPETIFEGGESELIFTVFNIASNPSQTEISFTDNLPNGIYLTGVPSWIEANGSTTTFIGAAGDTFVGIENLVFPEGVVSCTFSVRISADVSGSYLNNFQNFTNNNNVDTSQTSATLNVIVDTSNVDIEIIKTVEPLEAVYGEHVDFTITATNLGTTTATLIEVIDILPQGYDFVSVTTSSGIFDETTFIWSISSLNPDSSESLILTSSVISSTDLTNLAILHSVNEPDRDLTNNEDNATVEISNCLIIPEGISPNNDDKNDTLVIPCIEDYLGNTLKIYNRYGTQIYEAKNYRNTWDGTANMGLLKSSNLLPVGTYFYVLEVNGIAKPFVGYVYLNY